VSSPEGMTLAAAVFISRIASGYYLGSLRLPMEINQLR